MSAGLPEAEWPYCETVPVLEARDRMCERRRVLVEIACSVALVVGVIATWQGLEWFAVATHAAA